MIIEPILVSTIKKNVLQSVLISLRVEKNNLFVMLLNY